MAIVDERGRLFGRWNLLDLAVLVLIVGLIPLGYAAYVLFREQPPRLVSISPGQVQQVQEINLTIKGENLRPYMRVSAGILQARDFYFKSTEEAEVPFASLPPGVYDIVLYDQAQERSRLTNALTVSPSALPTTEIVAIGAFGNLDAAGAAKIVAGTKLPGIGEIVAVGKPVPDRTDVFSGSKLVGVPMRDALRVPAIVKFICYIRAQGGTPFCVAEDVTIAPRSLFPMPTPAGTTPFQVQRVQSTDPIVRATVTARLRGLPAVLAQVKAGDTDTGGVDNELAALSTVERVGGVRGTGDNAEVEVTLSANAQQVGGGWLYDAAPLRIGGPISLRTTRYEVSGMVVSITPRQ